MTASMGRVSATETGTEGKTFSVINCEGDASVAESKVGVGSTAKYSKIHIKYMLV